VNDIYVKHQKLSLKDHPTLNEKWVQELIANDPAILGLGDLVLKDKERSQPRAGRLDLLLRDVESERRYEVELQLGTVDESHIIRTIEYWDVERKRYPQYDHCAVIIAEKITSRFFNVISLFNGHIPLTVIQMQLLKIDDKITLVFTTILNELELGLDDEEDDEDKAPPANRAYWEDRAGNATLGIADKMISILQKIDNKLNLKYTKSYIGLEKDGVVNNFIWCKPRKHHCRFSFKLKRSAELDKKLEQADLDIQPDRSNNYKLNLSANDMDKPEFSELCRLAYEKWAS
jgi:hypothetical protein